MNTLLAFNGNRCTADDAVRIEIVGGKSGQYLSLAVDMQPHAYTTVLGIYSLLGRSYVYPLESISISPARPLH